MHNGPTEFRTSSEMYEARTLIFYLSSRIWSCRAIASTTLSAESKKREAALSMLRPQCIANVSAEVRRPLDRQEEEAEEEGGASWHSLSARVGGRAGAGASRRRSRAG